MQDDLMTYLKDVYQEKNREYHHLIKSTEWFYTVMMFFIISAFIVIWLMYHGVIISDSLESWMEAFLFFFSVSFVISNILMISIHKEQKASLSIGDDLDVVKNYQDTIQKLKDQTEKLQRFLIGLLVTSVISIFSLVLIILFII